MSANIRRDGSNRFVNDNQWGTFWSVGARWNISEENFLKDVSWLNNLKFRGSYGITGNERIVNGTIYAGLVPPAYVDTYSVANNVYNGLQGYGISFGYPQLQWEPTKQYNVGIDFDLFNRRLRGSFDHYNKKTEKLFLSAPVTSSSGTSSLTINSQASIENKGFELSLAYDVIKNENVRFTLRGNGSYNKNSVSGIIDNDGKIFFTNF